MILVESIVQKWGLNEWEPTQSAVMFASGDMPCRALKRPRLILWISDVTPWPYAGPMLEQLHWTHDVVAMLIQCC